MGHTRLHSRARCRRTHNRRTPAHSQHNAQHQPPTPPPTKRMTRHFSAKSFLLVAALLVVAVSAAEAASGSRALLQVINIPLVGTVAFGTDSIAEAGITQGLQSGLNSFAGHTLFEG